MKEERFGVGTKHITNEGYEIEILEKLNNNKRKVRFESGYEVIVDHSNIYRGKIKNPYHPSVCGVGYLGVGEYKAQIDKKITPEYNAWKKIIERCYDNKFQEKCPTYKGVVMWDGWRNFQIFAEWYNENYPKIKGEKFDLDKDLKQEYTENKIYSPDTCVFLPHGVNSFLANKYLNNTSGYAGVSWDKASRKWKAYISLFGEGRKRKHLGLFPTPELASQAYQKARSEQAEKVKDYLRSLNYLPEDTIQLIK